LNPEDQSSSKPNHEELLQLYKIAIDEYRFQVLLNWQRSQYYLILNAALVAAGGSLLGIQGDKARPLAAVLFVMGILTVFLSLLASTTQHSYYRAARTSLKRVEDRLGLGDLGIHTTPAMGSKHYRIGTVRNFQRSMLLMLGLIDTAGLVYSGRSLVRAVAYIWQSWF
jgi:hypothetical protein